MRARGAAFAGLDAALLPAALLPAWLWPSPFGAVPPAAALVQMGQTQRVLWARSCPQKAEPPLVGCCPGRCSRAAVLTAGRKRWLRHWPLLLRLTLKQVASAARRSAWPLAAAEALQQLRFVLLQQTQAALVTAAACGLPALCCCCFCWPLSPQRLGLLMSAQCFCQLCGLAQLSLRWMAQAALQQRVSAP